MKRKSRSKKPYRIWPRPALDVIAVAAFASIFIFYGWHLLFPTESRAPGTFYVSTTGSDSADGSLAHPWKSFAVSFKKLIPGDTLLARGGTYTENVSYTVASSQFGTSAAPINVQSYNTERPVIQGLLWVKNANYWIFNGINVTWNATNTADQHMIKFTDGNNWQFKNAEVWGAKSYAGFLVASSVSSQPANWTISGNCFHDTYQTHTVGANQDHLIYVNSGLTGSGGTITRNIMFNATNGEAVKLGGPNATSGGTNGVIVSYNTMYNQAQNLLVAWQSKSNLLDHNLLYQANQSGAGNLRGYQLTGLYNNATNNVGGSANSLILNDQGKDVNGVSYVGISDGGGNRFPVNPGFDSLTCGGFHPVDPTAQTAGVYAR